MTAYCDDFNLDYLIHTYAPTSNFKCCCDACGADTKRWYKRAELNEKDRCADAFQCYTLLANYMPQPAQSNKKLLMKLHSRHHRYVCTSADEVQTRRMLQDDYERSKIDKRYHLIVVDDDAFYSASKRKTLEGITKLHQVVFKKKKNNQHLVKVRLACCSCRSCLSMLFDDCLLRFDAGRIMRARQLEDEDSSFVLKFFGKDNRNRLMASQQWDKMKGDRTVIVGIDLNNNEVQLARMVSAPKKAEQDEEFTITINNYTYSTMLLQDTYYFPVQLLAKLDLNKSNHKPNCYLPMANQVYKVPLHCIIPPYLEEGVVRSVNNGKDSMNFTNYIACQPQLIDSRGGSFSCIQINSSDLRYLKGNTR